ncbi:MAG TPA: transglycosylase domain-containing protein [Bryobacteraceae bacterium]|nr:transglycosylase domain-containing protein [Bryobacteraceae bacterium]
MHHPVRDWAEEYLRTPAWSRTAALKSSWLKSKKIQRIAVSVVAGLVLLFGVIFELRTSWLESLLFRSLDRRISFSLGQGPSPRIQYPQPGPYDWTLGYARLPDLLAHLESAGYKIDAQVRDSHLAAALYRGGVNPVYGRKDQAGLRIMDWRGNVLYSFTRPAKVYDTYASVPPVVIETLLFIENRHMLDSGHPYRNPAVEWDRLTKAMLDYGIHVVDRGHPVIGGSTLATQLEKLRHSPGGRTHSPLEKLRQMTSASLAAYQKGMSTLPMQRQIVLDYINSIPLAAQAGYGDVEGLGDGLWAWYGTDLAKITPLLKAPESTLTNAQMRQRARAYRQVLSLLLALRSPNTYLVQDQRALRVQTDRYLRALVHQGIISQRLCDLGLREYTAPRHGVPSPERVNFVENKATNTVRMSLLGLLGLNTTYELDRLDLSVQTTIDQPAQQGITQFIEQIANRQAASAAGLDQYRLLEQSDPSKVTYSVTLYEATPNANVLRVQTDNFNEPLNINQSTKLELGSTAKLRTMINYLEIVKDLHAQYSGYSAAQLAKVPIPPEDHLTEWAVKYLASTKDRSLGAMLQAAMDRKYSGSTGESFYTGGGVHHFDNFESWESGANLTVGQAFENSVNLVFIRLMRDIVYYYRFRVPGATPAVLDDANDPARKAYLARFADQEGKVYESRFYAKYRGKNPNESLDLLTKGIALTPLRAAVIFRSVRPQANLDQFTQFLKTHLPKAALIKEDPATLYDKYGPDKFNLSDRGYLAHVHPLELWMLNYREHHPNAHLKDIWAASANERQDVYWWLFKTSHKGAQNNRIYTLLEQDAFKEIFKAWKRHGYPFDSLVPSYATTIGVSGDTPAALAELVGTIMREGMRYPALRITNLHFGAGTPTETVMSPKTAPGQRVMDPQIAALVRKELVGVVENGTGKRLHGGLVLSNGKALPIGGKTGTGDNRLESFTAHGAVIGSKPVSRTATFVFFIGDRYYGTVLAFVPGAKAASYRFTSALAVQILKDVTPQIKAMIEQSSQWHVPPELVATNATKSTGHVSE